MKNKEFTKVIENLKEEIDDKIKDFLENSQELKEFMEFRKNNFYDYSIRNNILIYKQDKTATLVAGFKKWQELGYNIKKGAKAIKILVPLISKNNNENKEEKYVYGYKYVNVFDIKNTIPTEKAIDIPSIDTKMKKGKSKYKIIELFKNSKEIVEQYLPVNIVKDLYCRGLTNGEYINIRKDKFVAMSGTLMHEFTHYLNHFGEKGKSQNQEEVEAELGAMLYGSYFNLDISGKYKYIALWKSSDVRLDEAFDVALASLEKLLYGTVNTKGLLELEENCN